MGLTESFRKGTLIVIARYSKESKTIAFCGVIKIIFYVIYNRAGAFIKSSKLRSSIFNKSRDSLILNL